MLLYLISGLLFCNLYFSALFLFALLLFLINILKVSKPVINELTPLSYKQNIKLSILIPVFNEEKYLPDFIRSIYRNNTNNICFIFINDSSTDNTTKILKEFQQIHNFTIINCLKSKNVSDVLNTGFRYIDYDTTHIGVLNGDCTIPSNCFDLVKNRLENYDIKALNLSNKSKRFTFNPIKFISNLEKKYKCFLFNYNESSLNNGYFISINLIDKWETITEDLNMNLKLKKNNIKIYQDPNIHVFDELPNTISEYINQKFRWVYGDIYNRLIFPPRNLFDIIVNMYYFFPLYSLLFLILGLNNNYQLSLQLIILIVEALIFWKSTNFSITSIPIAIFYSLLQFSFQIYFFIKIFYLKLFNKGVLW